MKNIKDIIKDRVSVRTFNNTKISEDIIEKIKQYIKDIENPFDIPIEFQMLNKDKDNINSMVIVGADTYIGAKVKKVAHAEEAFGYSFEKFVLYATSLGLGTVWLAATIDRPAFEKAMNLMEDEVMPAVTPIGYMAEKRSAREILMRKGLKSDKRLEFEKIFFHKELEQPLLIEESGKFRDALEAVRLAPSATNKQPWRVVLDDDTVHFYEKKTKGYAKESTGDIQKVDLGIALAHFELVAKESGIEGKYFIDEQRVNANNDLEYIISYR